MRKPIPKTHDLQLYEVELVNGPHHGMKSICSHDTVWMGGEKYLRGADDHYYWQPVGQSKN